MWAPATCLMWKIPADRKNTDKIKIFLCFRTNLNSRSGMKVFRIEERQPSAATSKSPTSSTVSPVWRTFALTLTQDLSSGMQKEWNKCPQRTISGGNELYRRLWRSAQWNARKFNSSSLVKVHVRFLFPSVALSCCHTIFCVKSRKYKNFKFKQKFNYILLSGFQFFVNLCHQSNKENWMVKKIIITK